MNRNELSPREMDEQLAAYDCLLATCRHLVRANGLDKCSLLCRVGAPEECASFDPRQRVRVAVTDDGRYYATRCERREYLDTTLVWCKRKSEAQAYINACRREDAIAQERTAPSTAG